VDRSISFQQFAGILTALILLINPATAAIGGIFDDISASIASGIEQFIRGLVDDFVGISVSSTSASMPTGSIGLDTIYSAATFTPNPYAFGPVQVLRKTAEDVYFEVFGFILILTVIAFVVHRMSITHAAALNTATGVNIGSGFNKLVFACAAGFGIFIFESVFLWMFLLINDELSKIIMLPSLNAIAFTPDNLSLYVMMGFAYGILQFCFYYRILIIMFWAAFGIVIGILIIPQKTQDWALNAHYYLIQIIFFQFAMIAWYTFCIVIIQACPVDMRGALYVIMVLASIYFAYKFIFGVNIIKAAGRAVKYAVVSL
jgi:hypothetical protein